MNEGMKEGRKKRKEEEEERRGMDDFLIVKIFLTFSRS